MKHFLFISTMLLCINIRCQSLLDADSIVIIQNNDTSITVLAVTIYSGLKPDAVKNIYRDRYERSQRLKVQSAKSYLKLDEKTKRAEAEFTAATGDTIELDSIDLNGQWILRGGEISINFTVTDNQSENEKVKIRIVSTEEIYVSVEKVGEIIFYRQDDNTWVGKGKDLYKITRRKDREKAKK